MLCVDLDYAAKIAIAEPRGHFPCTIDADGSYIAGLDSLELSDSSDENIVQVHVRLGVRCVQHTRRTASREKVRPQSSHCIVGRLRVDTGNIVFGDNVGVAGCGREFWVRACGCEAE